VDRASYLFRTTDARHLHSAASTAWSGMSARALRMSARSTVISRPSSRRAMMLAVSNCPAATSMTCGCRRFSSSTRPAATFEFAAVAWQQQPRPAGRRGPGAPAPDRSSRRSPAGTSDRCPAGPAARWLSCLRPAHDPAEDVARQRLAQLQAESSDQALQIDRHPHPRGPLLVEEQELPDRIADSHGQRL
jgi:hypothetical protein